MKESYLLIDIGGSNLRLAVADKKRRWPTWRLSNYPKYLDGLEAILKTSRALMEQYDIKQFTSGVIGIAGVTNQQRNRLFYGPNLQDWNDRPIIDDLEKKLGVKLILQNDAALAALGEARSGAGQQAKIVAYLTLSTGIGGARVVNGQIDVHTYGFEPGKQYIWSSVRQSKQQLNTVESILSGAALQRQYKKSPVKLNERQIWRFWQRHMMPVIANTIIYWSPDVLVLGGSLSKRLQLSELRQELAKLLEFYPKIPRIKRAQLGDECVLEGAWQLLK